MASFDFRLEMVRKDGSVEEADRFTLEHPDYDGHTERSALQHVMANKTNFGFSVDTEAGVVMCGGVLMPLAEFAKLQTVLVSKSMG